MGKDLTLLGGSVEEVRAERLVQCLTHSRGTALLAEWKRSIVTSQARQPAQVPHEGQPLFVGTVPAFNKPDFT